MAEGHPRTLTAMVAGSLCALLAAGPVAARPQVALLPRAIPALVPEASAPGEAKRLVVAVVPDDDAAAIPAARLHFVARQAAIRSARFEVVRLHDALDPQGAKEREDRAQEARTALDGAFDAYDNLDTVKSLRLADEAVKAWAETDLTLHMGDLTQAWLMKIASHVANGEAPDARREIGLLVGVNPDAQFSANYFPPDELAEAQRARKAVGAAEGILEVRTTPAAAEVYVNGRFAGISPVTVTNLADQEHFVTVLKPGFALSQARAKPGRTELTLRAAERSRVYEAAVRGVSRDPQGRGRDRAARELGEAVEADEVLVAHVASQRGGGVKVLGLRLDPKDGHNLAFAQTELPADGNELLQRADTFFASLLEGDVPRREGGEPVTNFPARAPVGTRKLAGYGLIGTGVLLMGVATFAGVRALGQQGEARRLAEARDVSAFEVADSGRTFAIVADVSWLVGLASAGAGGYLAFVDGEGSSSAARATKPATVTGTEGGDGTARPAVKPEPEKAKDEAIEKTPTRSPRKKKEERRKARDDDEDDLRNY